MILSVMYLYYVGHGQIEFSPWWLFAAAICDTMILGSIGEIIHGGDFALIDITAK